MSTSKPGECKASKGFKLVPLPGAIAEMKRYSRRQARRRSVYTPKCCPLQTTSLVLTCRLLREYCPLCPILR